MKNADLSRGALEVGAFGFPDDEIEDLSRVYRAPVTGAWMYVCYQCGGSGSGYENSWQSAKYALSVHWCVPS